MPSCFVIPRCSRRKPVFSAAASLLLAFLSGCGGSSSSQSTPPVLTNPAVSLRQIVGGLTAPLDLQEPDDNSGRLFVVEQGGTIRIVQNGALVPAPFLDISSKVHMEGESGLLGLVFHPNYAQDPRFFVNYVRKLANGQLQTVIAEFREPAANLNQADVRLGIGAYMAGVHHDFAAAAQGTAGGSRHDRNGAVFEQLVRLLQAGNGVFDLLPLT